MNNLPDFEIFTRRMVPLARKPFVTIQQRGTISLNAPAFKMIGSPRAVELLFSRKDRIIGIRGVDPQNADHAYPIRAMNPKQAGPFILSGRSFAGYYEIDTSVSKRYTPTVIDGVLCIDLNGGTVVVGSRAKEVTTAT